jgi:hypothetical protein
MTQPEVLQEHSNRIRHMEVESQDHYLQFVLTPLGQCVSTGP